MEKRSTSKAMNKMILALFVELFVMVVYVFTSSTVLFRNSKTI